VTLVLTLQSRDTLWVMADRRLSDGRGRVLRDDAVKVMNLEPLDGVGVVSYAGLGATPGGTEPSTWMSAVLRGRHGLTLDQSLGLLADVASKELPPYPRRMPGGAHFIVCPAFIRGVGPRLYTIDYVVERGVHRARYMHWVRPDVALPPRLGLAGSGVPFLNRQNDWRRGLLSLANANDHQRVSDLAVADRLAALNYRTHRDSGESSVGPRSIVVWRRRPEAGASRSGGAHKFYDGEDREGDSASIPTIANGMDLAALIAAIAPVTEARLLRMLDAVDGEIPDDDKEEFDAQMRAAVEHLPGEPDERLR